jgi:hypothetical protein
MYRRILYGCVSLALSLPAPTSAGHSVRPSATHAPIPAADLVGRWGDNGDCTKYVLFRGDGIFLSYTGGQGHWTLSGTRLVMSGRSGSFTRRVERIDRTGIRIINPDGSAGVSRRCPYASPTGPGPRPAAPHP